MKSSQPFRILLADDHPIFLIGLRSVLEQDKTLSVVGEASSPREILEWLRDHPCDLLITDFSMPIGEQNDGLRLLGYIRRHWSDPPILVVTMLSNPGLLREILALGVTGLLGKVSVVAELPEAVSQVRRHNTYVAASIRQTLLESSETGMDPAYGDPSATLKSLSPRELEVTRLLASGLSVGEIATRLNRSKQTVSTQKMSAMRKLGLENDAQLFVYLQDQQLT